MKLIDLGLHKRIEQVMAEAEHDNGVVEATKSLYVLLEQLAEVLGDRTDFWMCIEASIGNLGYHQSNASYRMGVADGMQLQQEVNALREGGRV